MRRHDHRFNAEIELMQALSFRKEKSGNELCLDHRLLRMFLEGKVVDRNIQNRILSHLDTCPNCLRTLKQLRESRKGQFIRAVLAVASIVVVSFVIWFWHRQHTSPQIATLNFESSGILRSVDVPPLTLPRSTTRLHFILSAQESPGPYEIELLKSVGDPPLTKAQGITHAGTRNLELDVDFDLAKYPVGAYVLAIRRSDSPWQYRSLRLK